MVTPARHTEQSPVHKTAELEQSEIKEVTENVEPYRPEPGTECEARTPRHNQWPKWTPVVVRAYDGDEVWFRCLITNDSFSGPIDSIEFRPMPELIPLSKGGELNQASWDDFVSRLRPAQPKYWDWRAISRQINRGLKRSRRLT